MDSILSNDTVSEKLTDFGIESNEYAEYLSDVSAVRNILADSKVSKTYFEVGRSIPQFRQRFRLCSQGREAHACP